MVLDATAGSEHASRWCEDGEGGAITLDTINRLCGLPLTPGELAPRFAARLHRPGPVLVCVFQASQKADYVTVEAFGE